MAKENYDPVIMDKLIRSRIQLLMKFPFFGTLALNFKLVENNQIQTAATDGKDFYYNKDFVGGLSDGEIAFLIAHEVMHCTLGHLWRKGSRNHEKFNIAADMAIHSLLKQYDNTSDFKFIEGALYDPKFNDKPAEEIYDLLPDQPSSNMGNGQQGGQGQNGKNNNSGNGKGNQKGKGKNGSGNGRQTIDDHSMWDKASTQQDGDKKAKDWQEKMISAAEVASAKDPGSVPGSIQRIIGSLTNPKLNWKELLVEFASTCAYDENYCPPAKRYNGLIESFGCDVVLPDFNIDSNLVKDLVIVCDTSGSYSDSDLTNFFSECVGIADQLAGQVNGYVLFCDTDVRAVYEFDDIADITECRPVGGGGTRMVRALDYCKEKQESGEWDMSGMIMFTDAYDGSYDDLGDDDYPFPSLFIINSDKKPGKFRNYVKYDPRI